jgi:small subunit ribosomal protein S20
VAIRHKSAQKAHRQNVERREANRQLRSRLRSALKDIRAAIDAKDTKQARAALNETISLIDKMAGKGIIHVNAAGRYKSRISRRLKSASA